MKQVLLVFGYYTEIGQTSV